eukprot:9706422-Ditylum_brightwellii.AAC.1
MSVMTMLKSRHVKAKYFTCLLGALSFFIESLGGEGGLFIPASMKVDKDKNDNIDANSKECD